MRRKDTHARQCKVDDRAVVGKKTEFVALVDSGNGDHVVLVGRVTQRSVSVLVAGSHDHDDIAGDRLGNRVVQRVIGVVFIIAAQTQVNDVSAVVERVVNALGGVRHLAVTVFVHDLDGEDLDIGGGSVGDNAADLGSVILVVVNIGVVVNEVVAVVGVTSLQIAVGLFDAGIHDRNSYLGEFLTAVLKFFLQFVESHVFNAPTHVAEGVVAQGFGDKFGGIIVQRFGDDLVFLLIIRLYGSRNRASGQCREQDRSYFSFFH